MVSVIIPNYNHSKYLKQRIDSVLEQKFQDFEVIILDDKSTDNSKDIIEQYREHPLVSQIVYNEKNSGTTFAQWNKGVSLAKGDFIWIAESDDVADPYLLQTLYDRISVDKNISIAFCQSYRMNSQGEVTGDWFDHYTNFENIQMFYNEFTAKGSDFVKDFLIHKNVIPNASAVLFRKETYLSVGCANTKIGYIGDWLVWLKMATIGDVTYTNKALNYFRYHEKSYSTRFFKENKSVSGRSIHIKLRLAYYKFLKKRSKQNSLIKLNLEILEDELFLETLYIIRKKQYAKGLKSFSNIIRYSPNRPITFKKLLKSVPRRLGKEE